MMQASDYMYAAEIAAEYPVVESNAEVLVNDRHWTEELQSWPSAGMAAL